MGGNLIDKDLTIDGTCLPAADMVGTSLMGFESKEIPVIVQAYESGTLL